MERGIVDISPINGLKAPTKEESRDRVLEDNEIVRLLRACRNDVYPFRQFVPILLATAQRRGELAEMRWSEVDLDAKQWVIPAERSKNGKPHVVPLSPYALEALNEVPRFLDCDFVFTTTRNSPVSGFSKMLRRLTQRADWLLANVVNPAEKLIAAIAEPQRPWFSTWPYEHEFAEFPDREKLSADLHSLLAYSTRLMKNLRGEQQGDAATNHELRFYIFMEIYGAVRRHLPGLTPRQGVYVTVDGENTRRRVDPFPAAMRHIYAEITGRDEQLVRLIQMCVQDPNWHL